MENSNEKLNSYFGANVDGVGAVAGGDVVEGRLEAGVAGGGFGGKEILLDTGGRQEAGKHDANLFVGIARGINLGKKGLGFDEEGRGKRSGLWKY